MDDVSAGNSDDAIHLFYLQQALKLSHLSPPKPTNFRVGAVLVSFPSPSPAQSTSHPTVLSTGYTLELPGNTHAEQCALLKLASEHQSLESELHTILVPALNVTLYTTLEPCGKRLSGNKSCVERIIETRKSPSSGIRRVIFGAKEPGTFVQDSASCKMMDEAGVEWKYVPGLEEEILKVAKAGHGQEEERQENMGTNVDDISVEERKRQEAMPRNPKKRMMEAPPIGD